MNAHDPKVDPKVKLDKAIEFFGHNALAGPGQDIARGKITKAAGEDDVTFTDTAILLNGDVVYAIDAATAKAQDKEGTSEPRKIDIGALTSVTAALRPAKAISRILGQIVARSYVTIVAGSGGVSKSTFVLGLALAAARAVPKDKTQESLNLGHPVHLTDPKRPDGFNLLHFALEDGQVHVDRAYRAALDRYGAPTGKVLTVGKDRLAAALGGAFRLLETDPATRQVDLCQPGVDALRDLVTATEADVVIIDPMKDIYGGTVMTNEAMNVLYTALADLAVGCDVAIIAVAHTRKPSGQARTAQDQHDVKHGSEAVDTSRCTINLNEVTAAQKTEWNVEHYRHLVQATVTKSNIGPKRTTYYELVLQDVLCADGNTETVPVAKGFVPPKIDDSTDLKAWPHIRAALEGKFVYGSTSAKDANGITIKSVLAAAYAAIDAPKPKVIETTERLVEKGWIVLTKETNPDAQNKAKVVRAVVGPEAPI